MGDRERRENQGCVSDFSDCLYIFWYPRVIAKYFKMTPGGPMAIRTPNLSFYMSGHSGISVEITFVGLEEWMDGWRDR